VGGAQKRDAADDELWTFATSAESFRRLAGRAGIVLLRDGNAIAEIVTLMN
jgi:hypothetical protein